MAVHVTARACDPILLFPNVLVFGEVGESQVVEGTITAISASGEPFEVVSVDPVRGGMKWTSCPGEGTDRRHLRFVMTSEAARELAGKALRIVVQPQGAAEVTLALPIYAWASSKDRG
jgi:hypothetical protein